MKKRLTKIHIIREDGLELNLTMDEDSNIFEWASIFRIILKWLTFSRKLIDEILPKEEELE